MVVEVVFQYLKYSLIDETRGKDNILMVLSRAARLFTLLDAIQFMQQTSQYENFLFNIDEASAKSTADLTVVLKMFGSLVCGGHPVLFTVTGIYNGPGMEDAVDYSHMKRAVVLLPQLTIRDCCDICKAMDLLDKSRQQHNKHFMHLVWLCGGVPRYLSFLIHAIASKVDGVMQYETITVTDVDTTTTTTTSIVGWFTPVHLPAIATYIAGMTHQRACEVLNTWKSECDLHKRRATTPPDVYSNLVSLCVAEYSVAGLLNNVISSTLVDGKHYTIEMARVEELAFITPTNQLTIPPIMLHHLHNQGQSDKSCFTIVLQNIDGVMSSRDNESLFVSVIAHRLRAKKLLGHDSALLSELLGVPADSLLSDPLIDTSQSVGLANFVVTPCTVTTAAPSTSAAVNEGNVNTPTASYADCFIRFVSVECCMCASY